MKSIGLIGSLAALFVSAPLAAQTRFKIQDRIPTAQLPSSGQARTSRSNDKIPPGQLPPAGMCRIWIDGVPPGQQPAPTDCQTAVATKPANARVIWGDDTAFPGKGKNKAKKSDRDDDDKKLKKEKSKDRQGRDIDDDDDDDDDRGVRPDRPSITGAGISSPAKKSKKGKGHGRS
jgi:hypothetical protein